MSIILKPVTVPVNIVTDIIDPDIILDPIEVGNHPLETTLNNTWEATDPVVKKAKKTLHSNAAWVDQWIDYMNFYYLQPMIKMAKKYTRKVVKCIKGYFAAKIMSVFLLVITLLMTVEAALDTFFPETTKMSARVISSMSTTKDSPFVRIKRHLVSIIFRPLFYVIQIPFLQTVITKTLRIAVFLSDEIIGEKWTDVILTKIEACIPDALKVGKAGTLRGMTQSVFGTVITSYQSVVAQVNTDAAMSKVGKYMPAWQEGATPAVLSVDEQKKVNARSRFG